MKINEERKTVSEEQVLFNKLSYEEQQFILKQMRMLQPCELECVIEEKKIPEKLKDRARFQYSQIPSWFRGKELIDAINENFEKHQKAIYELIDYLKSKGE